MLALVNGDIWTISDGVIEEGIIIIEDGRIKTVKTKGSIPEKAEKIDLEGKIVMPGLIDAHTHCWPVILGCLALMPGIEMIMMI